MKCLDDGHTYELPHFEDSSQKEVLHFTKKEPNGSGAFVTVQSGTTNEQVLEALIHRIGTLNGKAACRQNNLAITKLQEALFWLENRTAERKSRGVEGTPKA